jgi:hypothetical protein
MKSISRLSSGRVVVKSPGQVAADRYQLLDLASAEPNLGTAANGSVLTTTVTGQRIFTKNLTVDSVYSDNFLYTNGAPFMAPPIDSNIYNGNIIIGTNVTLVDTVSAVGISSVKWILTARDAVNDTLRSSTVDSVHDGAATYYNEYGVVLSDNDYEVAVFTSNITGGSINLYALGESANVAINYQRTTLGTSTRSGYIAGPGPAGPVGYTGSSGILTGNVTGNLYVSGTTFVTGDIIPTSNNTVNIGSPTKRFGTLYLAANTIDLGGATISTTSGGNLSFVTPNGAFDITANTVSFLSNVATSGVGRAAYQSINLYQSGPLKLINGTMRWYAPYDLIVVGIAPRVVSAADTAINLRINKNGTSAVTMSIPANQYETAVYTNGLTLSQNDYLTVDVLQVGSVAMPGAELYVQFRYEIVL